MFDHINLQVTMVAQVVSIQEHSSHSTYVITDGTGEIEAMCWLQNHEEISRAIAYAYLFAVSRLLTSNFRIEGYVRVTGTPRVVEHKRYLNAIGIRLSSDVHEVYFHILDAITASLMLEKQRVSIFIKSIVFFF